MDHELRTPVLFIVFNRPETTKMVFESIRNVRPSRLYIASDGHREGIDGESELVQNVREMVTGNINWNCELQTLFHPYNVGCRQAVIDAITWFFRHEEEGIILEDDCLPDESFFEFCRVMLEHYREDKRIMMISGSNFINDKNICDDGYFFSRYFSIWGWATWRRAWNLYDAEMNLWPVFRDQQQLHGFYSQSFMAEYVTGLFDRYYNNKDTWDIQWFYTCLFNNALSVVPAKNLVTNIGYYGTRAKGKSINQDIPRESLNVKELRHREFVCPEFRYDNLFYEKNFMNMNGTLPDRIRNNFFKLTRKISASFASRFKYNQK